jgi:hypothetical protein
LTIFLTTEYFHVSSQVGALPSPGLHPMPSQALL